MRGFRSVLSAIVAVVVVSGALPIPVTALTITGIDLGLPRSISATGIVRDASGAPIAGAVIEACIGEEDCGDAGFGRSDADGSFTVPGLSFQPYAFRATPPDATNLLPSYLGPSGPVLTFAEAQLVDVTGDVTGLELSFLEGVRITGRVTDQAGNPVPGGEVLASGGRANGGGLTDANGNYVIQGVWPGFDYSLQFRGAQGDDAVSGSVVGGQVVEFGNDRFRVDSDIVVDFVAPDGLLISGLLDGLDGRPAAVIVPESFRSLETPVAPDGTFAARGLWPGTYTLVFSVPSDVSAPLAYGIYDGQDLELAPDGSPGVPIEVTADVTGIRAIAPQLGTIRGQVVDGPWPELARVALCGGPIGCHFAATDVDGRFAFHAVAPGSWTIRAGALGRASGWYGGTLDAVDEANAAPIVVNGDTVEGIDIRLSLASSITGRITGPDGEPLEGMFVFPIPASGAIDEFGPGGAATGADGTYVLTGLVDDRYRLSVSVPPGTPYLDGYWSESGWTDDFGAAGFVTIASAPTILSVSPADGSTDVARTATARILFSTDVVGVSWRTLRLVEVPTGRIVPALVRYDATSMTATIDPAGLLRARTTYRLEVRAGITDAAGNALVPATFTFTTRR